MKRFVLFLTFALLFTMTATLTSNAAAAEPGFVAGVGLGGIKLHSLTHAQLSEEDGHFKLVAGKNDTEYPFAASIEVKDLILSNLVVTEYPIVAMRVKRNSTNSVCGTFDFATDDSLYAKSIGAAIPSFPIMVEGTYEPITDWQIVMVDVSTYKGQSSTVGDLDYPWVDDDSVYNYNVINLLPRDKQGTDDDIFYIDWIGYFKTEDDAKAYTKPVVEDTTAQTTAATTTDSSKTTTDETTTQKPASTNTTAPSDTDDSGDGNSFPTTLIVTIAAVIVAAGVAGYVIYKIRKPK